MANATHRIEYSAHEPFINALSRWVDASAAAELFDLFNQVSLLRYENIENTGNLVLCCPGTPPPPMLVRLEAPFELSKIRSVRKYLQITDDDLYLVSDCKRIYGITNADRIYPDSLAVRFRPSGIWELSKAGRVVLQVEAPRAMLPGRNTCQEILARTLLETFQDLSGMQVERLCCLIAAAERQIRGTNVLISANAAAEADRLRPQCTRIVPVPFTSLVMEHCTAIDGTIIIDTNGVCHAIGAILDGKVSERGDRTRGGRYNSAVMYVDTIPLASLIVVVSHDGTVDIVASRR